MDLVLPSIGPFVVVMGTPMVTIAYGVLPMSLFTMMGNAAYRLRPAAVQMEHDVAPGSAAI